MVSRRWGWFLGGGDGFQAVGMVSSGHIMGPMGPMGPGPMGLGPMGHKSFGSPVQAPLPGESIFRIPILGIRVLFGLCRLPYRGNPFSESCLQAGGISLR